MFAIEGRFPVEIQQVLGTSYSEPCSEKRLLQALNEISKNSKRQADMDRQYGGYAS